MQTTENLKKELAKQGEPHGFDIMLHSVSDAISGFATFVSVAPSSFVEFYFSDPSDALAKAEKAVALLAEKVARQREYMGAPRD